MRTLDCSFTYRNILVSAKWDYSELYYEVQSPFGIEYFRSTTKSGIVTWAEKDVDKFLDTPTKQRYAEFLVTIWPYVDYKKNILYQFEISWNDQVVEISNYYLNVKCAYEAARLKIARDSSKLWGRVAFSPIEYSGLTAIVYYDPVKNTFSAHCNFPKNIGKFCAVSRNHIALAYEFRTAVNALFNTYQKFKGYEYVMSLYNNQFGEERYGAQISFNDKFISKLFDFETIECLLISIEQRISDQITNSQVYVREDARQDKINHLLKCCEEYKTTISSLQDTATEAVRESQQYERDAELATIDLSVAKKEIQSLKGSLEAARESTKIVAGHSESYKHEANRDIADLYNALKRSQANNLAVV